MIVISRNSAELVLHHGSYSDPTPKSEFDAKVALEEIRGFLKTKAIEPTVRSSGVSLSYEAWEDDPE